MKVRRVLVYEGPEMWIRTTIAKSYVTPEGINLSGARMWEESLSEIQESEREDFLEIPRENRPPYVQEAASLLPAEKVDNGPWAKGTMLDLMYPEAAKVKRGEK